MLDESGLVDENESRDAMFDGAEAQPRLIDAFFSPSSETSAVSQEIDLGKHETVVPLAARSKGFWMFCASW